MWSSNWRLLMSDEEQGFISNVVSFFFLSFQYVLTRYKKVDHRLKSVRFDRKTCFGDTEWYHTNDSLIRILLFLFHDHVDTLDSVFYHYITHISLYHSSIIISRVPQPCIFNINKHIPFVGKFSNSEGSPSISLWYHYITLISFVSLFYHLYHSSIIFIILILSFLSLFYHYTCLPQVSLFFCADMNLNLYRSRRWRRCRRWFQQRRI